MRHACFVSTLLCFVYTLRCFYIFSRTNLLTSCHSASCLFSSVFGSRNAENQYSRNWTGQKPKLLFFPEQHGTTKQSRRGATGWPNPLGAGKPWRRLEGVWAPGPPPTLIPAPIRSLRWENPKQSRRNPEKPP